MEELDPSVAVPLLLIADNHVRRRGGQQPVESSATHSLRNSKPLRGSAPCLDEDNRKIIEHGRPIRACLKQPELHPMSVPAQIAVLLALTARLFHRVPFDQMTDAEQTVVEAATSTPADHPQSALGVFARAGVHI